MECTVKEEVQALTQVCVLVNTNISSEEPDDSEDNSGEILNACLSVHQEKYVL
jgi:hypothetical protein